MRRCGVFISCWLDALLVWEIINLVISMNGEEYTKSRLALGHGYMICRECGAKLYDIDSHKDMDRSCPYKKDYKGRCTDELL